MTKRHSVATRRAICDLYHSGLKATVIAAMHGLTDSQVATIISRADAWRGNNPSPAPRPARSTYIDNPCITHEPYPTPGHSWAEFTRARTQWIYGSEDRSGAQAADVQAWNRLGQREAA